MTMKVRKRKKPQSAKPRTKSKQKRRRKTNQDPVPRDLREAVVMAIDPGTHRLGWSVSRVYLEGGEIRRDWLARGSVFGKGKGCSLISGIAAQVRDIQKLHKVDVLAIEDYIFIPGRSSGIFAVPALIGVLKHEWYTRTWREPIMIEPSVWKKIVCNNGNANKMDVLDSLGRFLSEEEILDIHDEFKKHKLKEFQDPQDCFDAIAIDLYVFLSIQRYMKEEEVLLNGEEL